MNAEVSSADQVGLFGGGQFNTSDIDNFFNFQGLSHDSCEAQNVVQEYLASSYDSTRQNSSRPAMANEATKAKTREGSHTDPLPNEAAAAPTWGEGKGDTSDTSYTKAQENARVSSVADHDIHPGKDQPQRSASINVGHQSGPHHVSPHSAPMKAAGFPLISEPRSSTVTNPAYSDKPLTDEKSHASVPSASAGPSYNANHGSRSNTLMDVRQLVDCQLPSSTNNRQPLLQSTTRRESNLRTTWNAGELEAKSVPRHPGQQFDSVQDPTLFEAAHLPSANHVRPNTSSRGLPGLLPSHHSDSYHLANGGYPAHPARTQLYDDYPSHRPYYATSAPSPTHMNQVGRLSQNAHHEIMHGSLHHPSNGMNLLSQSAMSHLQPYGQDFGIHRDLAEQGFGSVKQEENSSPRSMGSVPTVGENRYEIKTPPQHRTLRDLEPTPIFKDEEDTVRLGKIYHAMLQMDFAQDNDGMKKTWQALSKDKAKVSLVCKKVLNACYVSHNVPNPLQQSVKPQHHYETLDERIAAICEAFKQQKTMCKHLMEAPYLYQVVDDPNLAAMRVVNNRKVNKGKKEAIEQGRKALKEKARVRGQAYNEFKHETEDEYPDDGYEDGEFEEDDETYGEQHGLPSYPSPTPNYGNPIHKRGRQTAARQMSSDDSTDLTYGVPPSKRTKKSGSMYQLNERNEMVDTSATGATRKSARTSQTMARRAIQNRRGSNYQPTLSDYNNSGTEVDSDTAAMGYGGWSEEDHTYGYS